MKTKYKVIGLSLLWGILAWFIESLLDYLFYYKGPSFWQLAFFDIPPHEFIVRIIWCSAFIFFSISISIILDRRDWAENSLQELKERYQGLYNNALVGLGRVSISDGKALEGNERIAQIFGYHNREAFIAEFVGWKHYAEERTREQVLAELKATGELKNFDARFARKDGSVFWGRYTARIYPEQGYIEGAIIDITEEKQAEEERRKLLTATEQSPTCILITDTEGRIEYVNPRCIQLTGYSQAEILGHKPSLFKSGQTAKETYQQLWDTITSGGEWRGEFLNKKKNGELYWEFATISPIINQAGVISHFLAVKEDITERKRSEEALRVVLEESQQRQKEIAALLEGARVVLEYHEFQEAARAIFDSCKHLIGATGGYVALMDKNEIEDELLFLDAGGLPCSLDSNLPMPIRGMREVAYRTGKAVYHNDFPQSEWMQYMPEGHARLDNVLFAPLVINKKAVGLLGLANKRGGFTENDARLASAFGELAAIALNNSRTLESLEKSEEGFRSVVQTANDAIISVNSLGNITFWNPAAETIFGYSAEEALGKPATLIMPEERREAHRKGINRVAATGESNIIGTTMEMIGLRKDGREFPISLSLASGRTREGIFFTGVIRDITEQKRTQEALKKLSNELGRRVAERTAELVLTNEQLRTKIEEHQRTLEALRESEQERRLLSAQLLITQEKERKRIAQELHDGIGQSLSAIKFIVENSFHQTRGETQPQGSGQSLTAVIPMIQEAVEEVRRICLDLRPPILDDLGILATMGWFSREFQTIYPGILIEQETNIQEKAIPDQIKTVIYRVLQEALNNIAKHSQANRIHLCLRKKENGLELLIEDNGRGFDLKEALSVDSSKRGFGLGSMRERVELSGGSFTIESVLGAGTKVRAIWTDLQNLN